MSKRRAFSVATAAIFNRSYLSDDDSDNESVTSCSSSEEESDVDDAVKLNEQRTTTEFVLSKDTSAWKTADGTSPRMLNFVAEPGIQVDTTGFTNIDYLNLFITDELIEILVEQTNLYARQYIEAHELKRNSRVRAWRETTQNEMRKFLAMMWLMGIVQKPTLASYWTRNKLLSTPMFPKLMSRDRFELLLKFLHFSDNSTLPDDNIDKKKHMIAPVMNTLQRQFEEMFVPTQHICLDESLLKWGCNLGFKVFIPAKRSRYGIKIYKLCCDQSTLNFKIYFGREEIQTNSDYPELGKLEKLVILLVQRSTEKGYILYTDRLYSSPLLYNELYKLQIGACGTAMKNKKYFPKHLVNTDLEKSSREVAAYRNGPVLAIKYSDKENVYMITTVHDHSVRNVRARVRGEGLVDVSKPVAIAEYNSQMSGVDKTDQLINAHKSARKTMKWTKKVVLYMLQHATLNAHYLFTYDGGDQTYVEFLLEVMKFFNQLIMIISNCLHQSMTTPSD